MVREKQKGAMASDVFIAILRARPGNKNGCGKRALSGRKRQGSGKRKLRSRIWKGHFFFAVRIGLRRILRAHERKQLIRALKVQVAGDAALGPGSVDGGFRGVQGAFVDPLYNGDFKVKDDQFLADLDGREPTDALV